LGITTVAACALAAGAAYFVGRESSSTSMEDATRGAAGSVSFKPMPDAPAPMPDSTLLNPPRLDVPEVAPTSVPLEPLDDGATAAADLSPTSIPADALHHESPASILDELPPTAAPIDDGKVDAPFAAPDGSVVAPTRVPEPVT
jgi:hypothetical protein